MLLISFVLLLMGIAHIFETTKGPRKTWKEIVDDLPFFIFFRSIISYLCNDNIFCQKNNNNSFFKAISKIKSSSKYLSIKHLYTTSWNLRTKHGNAEKPISLSPDQSPPPIRFLMPRKYALHS